MHILGRGRVNFDYQRQHKATQSASIKWVSHPGGSNTNTNTNKNTNTNTYSFELSNVVLFGHPGGWNSNTNTNQIQILIKIQIQSNRLYRMYISGQGGVNFNYRQQHKATE